MLAEICQREVCFFCTVEGKAEDISAIAKFG
jgi:hypothetical protein